MRCNRAIMLRDDLPDFQEDFQAYVCELDGIHYLSRIYQTTELIDRLYRGDSIVKALHGIVSPQAAKYIEYFLTRMTPDDDIIIFFRDIFIAIRQAALNTTIPIEIYYYLTKICNVIKRAVYSS